MKDLETLRKEIDQYDKEIVKYYEKRMEAVMEVMAFKRKEKLPIFHEGREQQILDRVVENLANKDFEEETRQLYMEIMKISRKRQSMELFPYNISLVGFMGTGKSSISEMLSQMLEMEWIDTDSMIEQSMDMPISQIFERYGEPKFRQVETEMIKEATTKKHRIISCGGGVVLKEENVRLLKDRGKVVLLEASPSTIYERLKHDDTRPLLKNNITIAYIEEMLEQRREAYIKAGDITINTDGKDANEIAMDIINRLLSI